MKRKKTPPKNSPIIILYKQKLYGSFFLNSIKFARMEQLQKNEVPDTSLYIMAFRFAYIISSKKQFDDSLFLTRCHKIISGKCCSQIATQAISDQFASDANFVVIVKPLF